MKKIVFLLLASFLVLAACGQEEKSKTEDKKETKSSSKDKKKEDKKSDDDKKETSNADNNQQEETQQANTQQQTQSTQEQPQTVQEQSPMQQEPTAQEKAEANAKVAKEHGYTGLPNGDAHSDVPVGQIELTPEELAKEEAKPEYQDVVESEEESDWVKGQDEWMNASESERTEIKKADAEKYGYEYDPTDYE
ncbi:cytoskeletal protein RodZ [Staphylococcus cohnii]